MILGKDPNQQFHWSLFLFSDQSEIAAYLISKNAEVNAITNDGCTPLHYAARGGN